MNRKELFQKLLTMNYVDLMAFLKENNRPSGGEEFLYKMIQKTFLFWEDKKFLHIACNNWYSTRLVAKISNMKWIWIDINQNMINSANLLTKEEWLNGKVDFIVMDARNLQFEDNSFDLVFSTWWVAFIEKMDDAVKEMIRVTKEGGFVVDMVLFYRKEPSDYLIKEISKILWVKINKRDLDYWINLYTSKWGLYLFEKEVVIPEDLDVVEIIEFCKELVYGNRYIQYLSSEEKSLLIYRLFYIFSIFAENHKYLWAALLIFRKDRKYQKALFKRRE